MTIAADKVLQERISGLIDEAMRYGVRSAYATDRLIAQHGHAVANRAINQAIPEIQAHDAQKHAQKRAQ